MFARRSAEAIASERRWRLFQWLCGAMRPLVRREADDAAPVWPEDPADVETLVTLAGHHLVTPALALALRDNASIPQDVRDYLEAALYLNRERNGRILDGLEIAAAALCARGITPVLLKGAANLAEDLYADPGMRFVGDLDLLVPAERAAEASAALADAGFDEFEQRAWRPVANGPHHHLPMQRHAETGVGIEVHHAVLPPHHASMLDAGQALRSAVPVAFRGHRLLLLAPTHRLLHNIVHDHLADGAFGRRSVSLRQLLDLSLLCTRHRDAIDWDALSAAFPGRRSRVLRYGLGLTRLLGASPPIGTPAEANRLRQGVERPRSSLGPMLGAYASRFVRQPSAALNFLPPGTWPARLEFWLRSVRRPRA